MWTAPLAPGLALQDARPVLTGRRRRWLESLDAAPQPLLAHLAQPPARRLGLYFERLWQFFLASDPATELLAHNLTVRDSGRTLGEFDCLYQCHRRQRPVHVEFAVKFYLGVPGATGEDALWMGPDTRDRLDRKLARLVGRQIRLADEPAARPQLQALGIARTPLREIVLRGRLFQPLANPLALPPTCNPACPTGTWLPLSALPALDERRPGQRYLPLPKTRWLSAASPTPGENPLSEAALGRELGARFAAGAGPAMVAVLDEQARETDRWFVTPDHWPRAPR